MTTVTVYSQPACHACVMTKRHLDRRGIAYTELPINDDVRAAAMELDIASAPVVCVSIDGVESWFGGYRPDRLDEIARSAA